MKAQLFSIYDKKAQYFEKPFTSQNKETAVRLIQNTMSDTNAVNTVKQPASDTLSTRQLYLFFMLSWN